MLRQASRRLDPPRIDLTAVQPARAVPSLEEDAQRGLALRPRSLPPKYFYDARGSQLFELICRTPEYYPTRTETALLQRHAAGIFDLVAPQHVIEFGSGSSRKTRILFDACDQLCKTCEYWPMDVCTSLLMDSSAALIHEYPWLQVHPLAGDYHGGLSNLPLEDRGTRLFVFLGGTIGNFTEDEADGFIEEVASLLRPGDALLLGADRVKKHGLLHAAYNDAAGLTAAFNRNVLLVLNRELGANFRTERFRHDAIYNPDDTQIEMYLVAEGRQSVNVEALELQLEFEDGERLLTEISRKFTAESLHAMLHRARLDVWQHFEAPDSRYSLLLAGKARSALS